MFLFEQKKPRNDAAYIVSIITNEGNFLYDLSNLMSTIQGFFYLMRYHYTCLLMLNRAVCCNLTHLLRFPVNVLFMFIRANETRT